MHLNDENAKQYKPNKKTDRTNIMKILKQIVKMKHIVPCAPDTIESVPYSEDDPFVLRSAHVIVAGGDDLDTGWVDGSLVIQVPNFDIYGSAVLYNPSENQIKKIEARI